MKYFVSFLFLFFFSSAPAFSDISSGDPAYESANYLKSNDIVSGYGDGTFRPEININRVEFLKILLEADDSVRACTKRLFYYSDTEDAAWYNPYIQEAGNCGFATGYPDGTFRPADTINVAEASKIIYNMFQAKLSPVIGDVCASQTKPWYQPFTCALETAKISAKILDPGRAMTRGDMAVMIYNTLTLEQPAESEAIATPKPVNSATEEPVYEDFSDQYYQSLREKNTPFVLNFSASWCPVCRALDKKISNELSQLPNGTVVLKVNYDNAADLKKEFGITRQTSGVLFDANGNTEVLLGTLSYEKIRDFFQ